MSFRRPFELTATPPARRARGAAQPRQDSTLDNLVHAAGYVTSAPGTLGAVVERGKGPIDMVLVSGFGVGASAFDGFMQRNANRYHMLAVTLPGFEGTAAPPMPPPGTSYGDQTWTRAATDAVVKLIRERKLDRPVLVGHFVNGTQVAMRIALEHPELMRAVVLLAGTPRFEPVDAVALLAEEPHARAEGAGGGRVQRAALVQDRDARRRGCKGNFVATDYSVDSALGKRFADRANEPPLPVLVRYLCEFHASDLLAGSGAARARRCS